MTDSVFTPPLWWHLLGGATRPLARRAWPDRTCGWTPADRATVWLHAASVGEAKGLLRVAASLDPSALTLTASTTTGLERLRRERPDLESFLLPWDDPDTVDRFLAARRVERAVFLEAEVWPAAFGRLSARGIPLAMVSMRCAPPSRRRWRLLSLAFPGWTDSVSIAWADGPASALDGMGLRSTRTGSSLKWAGVPALRATPVPGRVAALSYHLRDLPELAALVRRHPGKAWLWFPRHLSLAPFSRLLAGSLGLDIVSGDALPTPGQVWISPRLGLVSSRLPGCESAWVSPGHDREEPFRLGVPTLLNIGSENPANSRAPEETLEELLAWIHNPDI